MLTEDKKENFQKSFPERGELPPNTPKGTQLIPESSIRPGKRINSRSGPNHSQYIGVFWCSHMSQWHANFRIGNKKVSFGRHMTEKAAALAYDLQMRKLVKRLNKYNFPDPNDSVASEKSDQMLVKFQPDEKIPEDQDFYGSKALLDKKALREDAANED